MNILVGNSTILLFPIFFLNDRQEWSPSVISMLAVELFCYFLSAIFSIHASYIIYSTQAFHTNMNLLLLVMILNYFECLIGRLMVIPYEKGWVTTHLNRPFRLWTTSEVANMPHYSSCFDEPFLFLGCFFILHYYIIMAFCLFSITIERAFATYFINDYEKTPRRKIVVIIYTVSIIISLTLAFMAASSFPFEIIAIIWVVLLIIPIAGFTYVWYINIRVYKKLSDIHGIPPNYTLAARFQAKENVKSFKFIVHITIFVTVVSIIELPMMAIQGLGLIPSVGIQMMYILEIANSSNPVFVAPFVLMIVPPWKQKLLEHLNLSREGSGSAASVVKRSSVQETDQYFNQFHKAWH